MRHPFMKALALVLAALMATGAFFFFCTAWYILDARLYETDVANVIENVYSYRAESLANSLVKRHAQKFCQLPLQIQDYFFEPYDDETLSYLADLNPGTWYYTIHSASGVQEASTLPQDTSGLYAYSYTTSGRYMVQTEIYSEADRSYSDGNEVWYLKYADSPNYQVTVYLQESSATYAYGLDFPSLRFLYSHRFTVLILLCGCAVAFAGCLVYLGIAAGRRKKAEPIRPGGLNRLPLDLYFLGAGALCALLIAVWVDVHPLDHYYENYGNEFNRELFWLKMAVSCGLIFLVALIATAFLFALASQCKAQDHYWWRNSILCRLLKLIGQVLGKAWDFLLRTARWILEFYQLLPVMWQWLVIGFGILFMVILSIFLESVSLLVFSVLIGTGLIVYGAWAFGQLLKGAQQMAQGSLRCQVRSKYMIGAFRSHAQHLNALSDVTMQAADAHLRSERMKAELITNVSHDIKTPLTSIINYIDLLPRAENEEQQQEYLQILQRQSLRLKRLIEDLTEMSRASTGNIQTNIAPMDAVEGLTQALGEFSDKLTLANLHLCTQLPEEPVMIAADGRLFWRVLSNLLSNVVKYAMPGTRVYVQLIQSNGFAQISVKNISREPLVKDARELTERFVRGDESRNTEGSGLGLSIAGSLMDVQKGSMQVQLDADLFTATLNFPLASM